MGRVLAAPEGAGMGAVGGVRQQGVLVQASLA
jgi:hypothetical protein